ncbi:hypothetical protein OPS25_05825 [Alteromonas ponticola]|uniref:ATPase BadF/BadG/BcrA/BcrD type domain-containing protein n=1 Tax=Alteromonas aquimaris TaxID=2998417 RepID=A0ABT3P5G7_9ALTE|nr:BadF/BadG/BcrA/BcrD ATPase family protein [Alteromonas aquimaris]MCW8108011.1 hypothetical protein [Alteromonas aquimaris]
MGQSTSYYIGIDGGGTRCRAKLFNSKGECLGLAETGGANVASDVKQAKQSLLDVITEALRVADLHAHVRLADLHVAAGLAGANLSSARHALINWAHPFASFHFTSDLATAIIGAHGGGEGALLIVGTGSCAASWQKNTLHHFGGHGFTLGDKGSGAWLGKQAIIHLLESLEGVFEQTGFCRAIHSHLGLPSAQALVDHYHHAPPSVFGKLAPLVMQSANKGDEKALEIVKEGADYLSKIASLALNSGNSKLAITGGVASLITPYLSCEMRDALVPVAHSPEWGAVYLFYKERCQLVQR